MSDFSIELNEDQLQVVKWVHDFAEDVVRPAAHEWDEREETPWPIIEEAAKIGLYSFDFVANCFADPTGLLLPLVNEEMAWGDAGITLAIFGSTLGVAGIVATGTPEQVAEWVPQCFGQPGDLRLAAFCVSEADAGSDVSNLKTRAVYDEATDTWTLNGTKTWITNGGIADVHVVVASVEPELGARGQASFIVPPQTPGTLDGPEVQEDGDPGVPHRRGRAAGREGSRGHASSAARTGSTSASRGPARESTGRRRRRWPPSRPPGPPVAAQAVGIARAAYEYSLDYAKERRPSAGRSSSIRPSRSSSPT